MSACPLPAMICRVVGLSRLTLRSLCGFPCRGAPSVLTIAAQVLLRSRGGGRLPVLRCASRWTAHLTLPGLQPDSFSRVVQRTPLRRHHLRCPLPASVPLRRCHETAPALPGPSAQGFQPSACSVLAVSHRPDGLLHRRLMGLLHPIADPGVHRVSAPRRLPTGDLRFPTDASALQSFSAHTAVTLSPRPSPLSPLQDRVPDWGSRRPQGVAPRSRPQRGDSVAGGPRP